MEIQIAIYKKKRMNKQLLFHGKINNYQIQMENHLQSMFQFDNNIKYKLQLGL